VGIILPVAAAAVVLGVLINALLVRLALTPLRNLEQAADQVRAGREDARAAESAVSDAATEQVVRAFNAMLESLSVYRRRLRAVAIRALDAEEAERKRLSVELHDNTAQSLAAILVQLRVARAGLPADHAARLTAISEQISQLINDLRHMAQQLRPPALDMLGLGAAITTHARNISESAGVRIDVQLDGQLDGALTRETELALYRVVQEALLNVVRHAEARTARVELRLEPTLVIARVVDDGRGFDVARAFDQGALGLIGMSERASYIGGSVEIQSRRGAGTSVQIVFPIKEAAHV
jgi:two-component system sensor histidine kinase UhpB